MSSVSTVQSQSGSQTTISNAYEKLDLDTFMQLFVAELENQDPMEPMGNSEILNQISTIREIESTTRLTDSLESVALGQNVSTASSLIGRTVTGLTDGSNKTTITGMVDKVTVADGVAKLQVGGRTIPLSNVSAIEPAT